ncbi:phosphotransferase [Clostridium sp. JNZ X4-2]
MLKDELIYKIKEYISENRELRSLGIDDNYSISFLAQGEYNINYVLEYDDKKYVFRVNTGSQLELKHQILYEFNVLRRLHVSQVTPEVYYADDRRKFLNYGILIMEFLKGKPLNYKTDLEKAADIFSKIHSLDLNEKDEKDFIVENNIFSSRVLESKKWLKDFMVSPLVKKEQKHFFYKFLQQAESNIYREKYFVEDKWHVINNTEVNSNNFIIGEKNNYLIDWEKPVISDPCQDLTQFLAKTTTLWKSSYVFHEEEINRFFAIYENKLKKGKKDIRERVHMYAPYLYLRALSWCAYAWLQYRNPEKDIKNEDTLKKIEEYLNLDFLESLKVNLW